MPENVVLVDLTRAWTATSARVMTELDAELAGGDQYRGHVLITRVQEPELTPESWPRTDRWEDVEALPVALMSVDAQVREWALASIARCLERGERVTFFSFNTALLNEIAKAHPDRDHVNPRRLAEVSALVSGGPTGSKLGGWDESLIPSDEVAALVAVAVERAGGSIPQVQIRDELDRLDGRLAKRAGTVTAVPGFVSRMVAEAVSRGYVTTQGSHPTVLIGLTDVGREAALKRAATLPRMLAAPHGSRAAGTRSEEFLAALRAAELGPYMPYRWMVYSAIRDLSDTQHPFGEIVGSAVRRVRDEASQGGVGPEGGYPWSRLRALIEALIRRSGVALGLDGQPLELSWRGRHQLIVEFERDWEFSLDALLVQEIAARVGALEHGDVPDIAGALYGERTEEAFDRVYRVVEQGVVRGWLEDVDDRINAVGATAARV